MLVVVDVGKSLLLFKLHKLTKPEGNIDGIGDGFVEGIVEGFELGEEEGLELGEAEGFELG